MDKDSICDAHVSNFCIIDCLKCFIQRTMCGDSIIVSVDPHSALISLYCYWSFSHQFNVNDTIRAVNADIVYCKRTQEEFGFHVASGKTGDWKSAPFVVF